MIQQYLVMPITELFNQGLKCFPLIEEQLSQLDQKTIMIICDNIVKIKFFIQFEHKQVKFLLDDPGTSDLKICSDVYHLAKLAICSEKEQQSMLTSGKVVMTGDVIIADQLKKIMSKMEIDWEEKLSHFIGDIAAHQVGNIFKGANQWGKSTIESTEQNITEYLQEEIRLLPPREEIDDFFYDVDLIRDDIERLEAIWHRLKK